MKSVEKLNITDYLVLYIFKNSDQVEFGFGKPVAPEIRGCVNAVISDPARAIAATVMAMKGNETNTPENRALLGRYVATLGLRSPPDVVQAKADVLNRGTMLTEEMGRCPSDAELAEAMLTALRAVEICMLGFGDAK